MGNTSLSDYLASVTYGSRSRLGMELEPAAAAGATPAVFPDRDSKSDCSADALVRPRPRATSRDKGTKNLFWPGTKNLNEEDRRQVADLLDT
jgi:hypothetical protein